MVYKTIGNAAFRKPWAGLNRLKAGRDGREKSIAIKCPFHICGKNTGAGRMVNSLGIKLGPSDNKNFTHPLLFTDMGQGFFKAGKARNTIGEQKTLLTAQNHIQTAG